VVHYLLVGSRQRAGPPPALTFSPTKFVITCFLLVGLAGAYSVGASIATPALFDAAFGPARDTAFVRVWNHTYFGFVLLASLLASVVYLSVASAREHGIAGALHWLTALLSLRSGRRFLGVLNWILLLALISNFATGFFILGTVPLFSFPRLPLHAYAMENWARLAHDVGTAFIVASFSGQIYLRLIPGNQWMLKTMFAGYEARA
jgi:Ni,Fe-hydrogenase I cytochrome b subunit